MKRWEYLIVELEMTVNADDTGRLFSNHGAEGWELVATRPVVTSVGSDWQWLAIFKRPAGSWT